MIKLIASDMDETLLDETSRVPAGFADIMAALKERHVLFMAASGRQYFSLRRLFPAYADDMVFAAENGTYILYQGQEIFSSTLSKKTVQDLLALVATIPAAFPAVCGKKAVYIQPSWAPYLPEMEKYFIRHETVQDFSDIDDEILEVALCDCVHRDAAHTIFPYVRQLQDQFHLSQSSECWVDIKNEGINKGSAIRCLQDRFQLKPDECAAFGDYLNDKEMLEAVHYSFAMENAQPEILATARFQAKSNRQHGVLQAIQGLMSQSLL